MESTDGLLHHMTTRISTNPQTYKMEPEDEVVPKVKDILQICFNNTASMVLF